MKCSSYIQHTVANYTDPQMQAYIEKICKLASLSKFTTGGRLFEQYLNTRTKFLSSISNVDRSHLNTSESFNGNKKLNNMTLIPSFESFEVEDENCWAFR